jgi:soluble lytic murein transglycosylase-like protein
MKWFLGLLLAAVGSVGCSSPSHSQPTVSATTHISQPTPGVMPHSSDPRIPAEAQKYRRQIIKAWQYYFGLEESPATGFGQIHQESRFSSTARSGVGAEGLGQFMPSTAEWVNSVLPPDQKCGGMKGCPLDPTWAINATCIFDSRLFTVYGRITTVEDDRWGFSLAAYNAGEGSVIKERNKCAATPGCLPSKWFGHTENVCSRAPSNCVETRDYSRVIMLKWKPLYESWLAL